MILSKEKAEVLERRAEANQRVCEFIYRKTGRSLKSTWDLVNTGETYSDLIPALIEALELNLNDDGDTVESLARALTVKEARGQAAPILIKLFKSELSNARKWSVGNALSVVVTKEYLGEIIELWKNKAYGKSRQMLAVVIGKSKDPRALTALIEQIQDPDIAGHAVWGLFLLNDAKARSALELFLTNEQAWVRNYAKKALAKFDRKP